MHVPIVGLAAYSRKLAGGSSQFVGNLPTYINALQDAGAIVLLLPASENSNHITRMLDVIDGLVLPGGNDVDPAMYSEAAHQQLGSIRPERDRFEIALVRDALERDMPVLGICRGMQVLNVALGGSLYQDIPSQYATSIEHDQEESDRDHIVHSIELTAGSQLHQFLHTRTLQANSMHHQAINCPGQGVVVTGKAPDGIIEAIEVAQHRFAIAVQYHPEEMYAFDAQARGIFTSFVAASALMKK